MRLKFENTDKGIKTETWRKVAPKKKKDACIQKSYWRWKTGTWIQPFLSFTGKMETREKKSNRNFNQRIWDEKADEN